MTKEPFHPQKSSEARRVVVSHQAYGCDTGCCGHVILIDAEVDEFGWAEGTQVGDFDFMHSGRGDRDLIEYVREVCERELGAEHCTDLDWDSCVLVGMEDCW